MDTLAVFGGRPAVTESWPKWPCAGQRERELLDEVLSSTMWGATGFGPKIRQLNCSFADLCGVKYAAAVANGTVSMELCYRAWDIGPGDEVIVPAFTFMATAMAIHSVGATAVYADIDPLTLNLDPDRAAEAVSGRTAAIVPVHLAGHPADMDPILELAGKHRLKVLEDAAQGLGGVYKGRKVGSLGDAASFSFQQSKRLQSGEGGIVASNDGDLIDVINYSLTKFGRGIREKYEGHVHYRHATNYSYTELQAAVLLAQMERFEDQARRRAENARFLYEQLADIPGIELLRWQPYCNLHGENAFVYRFKSEEFEGVSRAQHLAALHAEGIPAMSWYPMPLYEQPLYRAEKPVSERHQPCPVAEMASREACFFENHILLAGKAQLVQLVEGVRKVRAAAGQLRTVKVDGRAYMGSAVLAAGRATAIASAAVVE